MTVLTSPTATSRPLVLEPGAVPSRTGRANSSWRTSVNIGDRVITPDGPGDRQRHPPRERHPARRPGAARPAVPVGAAGQTQRARAVHRETGQTRMSLFLDDGDVRLYHGDALTVLQGLDRRVGAYVCDVAAVLRAPGLRTGRWEGGDPDCDHGRRTPALRTARGTAHVHGRRRRRRAILRACAASVVPAASTSKSAWRKPPNNGSRALSPCSVKSDGCYGPDGTLWLEVGDSYAAVTGRERRGDRAGRRGSAADRRRRTPSGTRPVPPGYKPKDLIGAPWLLAFALRADGW